MLGRLSTLTAAATLCLAAGAASAATLATGSSTCNLADLTTSTACEGAFSGNDSNTDLDGIFSMSDWTEIVKVDGPASSATANGITLSVSPAGGTSGIWSVSSWDGFSTVMAVLKGGNTFSAYLLDLAAGTSGTWNTDGILKGNGKSGPGLSHFTLYSGPDMDVPPAPVPLPAAGLMLLGGVGLLALRRRKRS